MIVSDIGYRLHHYLFQMNGKEVFSGLSKYECYCAFLTWVNDIRINASDSPKELLMCPMLWCRDNHEEPRLAADHATSCEWLSDTWYWCAQCSRPESFMYRGGTGTKTPYNALTRRLSKLERAKDFFREFRRKASGKAKTPWSPSWLKARAVADSLRHASDQMSDSLSPRKSSDHDVVHEMAGSLGEEFFAKDDCDTFAPLSEMAGWLHNEWAEMASRSSRNIRHELPQPQSRSSICTSHLVDETPGDAKRTTPGESAILESEKVLLGPPNPKEQLFGGFSDLFENDLTVQGLDSPPLETPTTFGGASSWLSTSSTESLSAVAEPLLVSPISIASSTTRRRKIDPQPLDWPPPTPSQIFSPSHSSHSSHNDPHQTSHDFVGFSSSPLSSSFDNDEGQTRFDSLSPSAFSKTNSTPIIGDKRRHIIGNPIQKVGAQLIENNLELSHEVQSIVQDLRQIGNDDLQLAQEVQSTVQDLRELIHIVIKEWKRRLASTPDLFIRCTSLPSSKIVDLGITALKRGFQGTFSNTFDDVFSLAHVACAIAYLLHGSNDRQYCYDSLFHDLLQWEFSMCNENDTLLFARVMDKLAYPQGSNGELSATIDLSIAASCDVHINVLRAGRIMKDCSMFLDGKLTHIAWLFMIS